jgi:hypothetical protein
MQGAFDSNVPPTPAIKASGTNGANGVQASSDTGTGLLVSGKVGVAASSPNGVAVGAICHGTGIGLRATSDGGWAVNAQSRAGVGVLGASDTDVGVQGVCQSGNNFGVVGMGANAGVAAFNPNNDHAAYLASACCAAWFTGNVQVTGRVMKGGGGFRIDHPLAPAEQYLSHSFVESSEMKNLYDGVVVADGQGHATVELPDWFEAVNTDVRYQLTAIGGPAPELHVHRELVNGRFQIAGAGAGMKVCWQVSGVRRDPWARAHPLRVEEEKSADERGYYLHPELNGADARRRIADVGHSRSRDFRVVEPRPDPNSDGR